MLAGNERTHLRGLVVRGTDPQPFDPRCEPGDQSIRDIIAHRYGDGDGHTALARRAEGCSQERIRGLIEVRVGHHDEMILRTTQRLYAFAVRRSLQVNVACNRRRAHEADSAYIRVMQQRVHRFLVALHDVEDAVREAGLLQQSGQPDCRGRVALGGLQNERVTARERNGKHPHRHHRREVEWCDARHDTQRLAHAVCIDATADVLTELALQQMGNAAGELDHFQSACQFAMGIADCLAVLARDESRDLIGGALHEFLEPEQHTRTPLRWRRCPAAKRLPRGTHRCIDVVRRGKGHERSHRAQGGVEDIARAFLISRNGAAAYPVRHAGQLSGHLGRIEHIG